MIKRTFTLHDFVRESNRIEGIFREPLGAEIAVTRALCELPRITISDLVETVRVYQPDAIPRFVPGLDVRVGPHVPPRGGPMIQVLLQRLLDDLPSLSPFESHVAYETIHPFTDGNGRSGRALWLWRMGGIDKAPLGFLHHFYYQSLQGSRLPTRFDLAPA